VQATVTPVCHSRVWKKKFIKKTLIFISHAEKCAGEKLTVRQKIDMQSQFNRREQPWRWGGFDTSPRPKILFPTKKVCDGPFSPLRFQSVTGASSQNLQLYWLQRAQRGPPPCAARQKRRQNALTLTTNASLSTISNNFNSLFRVFFIFPSRYLLAIGLPLTYLALGGIYHPFRAALSSNPTRRALSVLNVN